jgi:hypothetical protein
MSFRVLIRFSALTLAGLLAASVGSGRASRPAAPRPVLFAPASPALLAKCAATARAVRYPAPCPTHVPVGLVPFGGRAGCEIDIIGPARRCPNTIFLWRGWVVGSSATATQHLVVTASPRPLESFARVVNGPAWYPGARVRLLGRIRLNGWKMSEVFVPATTNDGSAFAGHVVLIWTVGGHTYGVGFHDVSSIAQTLSLDLELARNIELVGP